MICPALLSYRDRNLPFAFFRVILPGYTIQLQAYFLVADDIMDQSFTRRSQVCWFRVDGVGNTAINDSFMLEAAIYYLLKKHFKHEAYYVDLLELFLEVRPVPCWCNEAITY
jgi:farnesyl diphosphate synthase